MAFVVSSLLSTLSPFAMFQMKFFVFTIKGEKITGRLVVFATGQFQERKVCKLTKALNATIWNVLCCHYAIFFFFFAFIHTFLRR